MSEINEQVNQEPVAPVSTSRINLAVEAVMDLIDGLGLYSKISRGALGTGNGITCEIGPTSPETVWLDKNQYIPIDLTINGKHDNLQTLSDALNTIHESLTMLFDYPEGDNWEIVDITTLTEPQMIGRESDNKWMMASALLVKVATLTPEPVPDPEPTPDPDPEPTPDPEPEPTPDPEPAGE